MPSIVRRIPPIGAENPVRLILVALYYYVVIALVAFCGVFSCRFHLHCNSLVRIFASAGDPMLYA